MSFALKNEHDKYNINKNNITTFDPDNFLIKTVESNFVKNNKNEK